MKQVYSASVIKGGVLGGGIILEDDRMTYKTGKVTAPEDVKNLKMPFSDIKNITCSRLLFFPVIEVTLDKGKYKFIVFNRKRLLKNLKQMNVVCD